MIFSGCKYLKNKIRYLQNKTYPAKIFFVASDWKERGELIDGFRWRKLIFSQRKWPNSYYWVLLCFSAESLADCFVAELTANTHVPSATFHIAWQFQFDCSIIYKGNFKIFISPGLPGFLYIHFTNTRESTYQHH